VIRRYYVKDAGGLKLVVFGAVGHEVAAMFVQGSVTYDEEEFTFLAVAEDGHTVGELFVDETVGYDEKHRRLRHSCQPLAFRSGRRMLCPTSIYAVSALGSPMRNWCLMAAQREHTSRDGARPLEALVIDERVAQHEARCDSRVLLDWRVGQLIPGRLGGEGRDIRR